MTLEASDFVAHPPSEATMRRFAELSGNADRMDILRLILPDAFTGGQLDLDCLRESLCRAGSFDMPFCPGATPAQTFDLFSPPEPTGYDPCVILVHGGGWVAGDKREFIALGLALARQGYKVMSVNYRLAPADPFPAALHDLHAALRFVHAQAEAMGIDPHRISGWGGSAGAHLVALAAATTGHRDLDIAPDRSASFRCIIAMAGPMDLTAPRFIKFTANQGAMAFARSFLGSCFQDHPELYRLASPLTHMHQGMCPTLLLVGSEDHTCINDQTLARLIELNVPARQTLIPEGAHGCWHVARHFKSIVEAGKQFLGEHA